HSPLRQLSVPSALSVVEKTLRQANPASSSEDQLLVAEARRDRHAAVLAERTLGYLHAGRRLAALVLAYIHEPCDAAHEVGVMALSNDLGYGPVLLHVALEDGVEHVVRWE